MQYHLDELVLDEVVANLARALGDEEAYFEKVAAVVKKHHDRAALCARIHEINVLILDAIRACTGRMQIISHES